jgi:hypothetical protein
MSEFLFGQKEIVEKLSTQHLNRNTRSTKVATGFTTLLAGPRFTPVLDWFVTETATFSKAT